MRERAFQLKWIDTKVANGKNTDGLLYAGAKAIQQPIFYESIVFDVYDGESKFYDNSILHNDFNGFCSYK